MKRLILKINPFVVQQKAYFSSNNQKEPEEKTFELPNMTNFILEQGDLDRVTLFCEGKPVYLEEVIKEIQRQELQKYRKNKIFFEIKEWQG